MAIAETVQPEEGAAMTRENVEAYLQTLRQRGRRESTVQSYRRCLLLLYEALPQSREIERNTLARWRDGLLDRGYTARTVNVCLSAANNFLAFLGRQDCQLPRQLQLPPDQLQPELTRAEYLRLLSAARSLGRERTYLLVKLFASTGLTLLELPKLTVEAVQAGSVETVSNGAAQRIHIPACLQRELLAYTHRQGLTSGPVFRTRSGRAVNRSTVSDSIRRLCRDARVAEEKGNPRCLKRLYQETVAGIESSVRLLVEQAHDRLLETEQLSVGWEGVRAEK